MSWLQYSWLLHSNGKPWQIEALQGTASSALTLLFLHTWPLLGILTSLLPCKPAGYDYVAWWLWQQGLRSHLEQREVRPSGPVDLWASSGGSAATLMHKAEKKKKKDIVLCCIEVLLCVKACMNDINMWVDMTRTVWVCSHPKVAEMSPFS